MPTEDDFDRQFREIEEQFEGSFFGIDTDQEEAYAHWLAFATAPELVSALAKVSVELEELKERLFPRTERGHELHSKHTAIKLQMNRRRDIHG